MGTRRSFLMGLGAFAGAAIALPKVPAAIFDMGRAQSGLVLPDWVTLLPEVHGTSLVETPWGFRHPWAVAAPEPLRPEDAEYTAWLAANVRSLGWNRGPRSGEQIVAAYKATPEYQDWHASAVLDFDNDDLILVHS